jgi:hypothetical protein
MAIEISKNYLRHDGLVLRFRHSLSVSGFEIVDIEPNVSNVARIRTKSSLGLIEFNVYMKNVSQAGWNDKPWIKRIQVGNVKTIAPGFYSETTRDKVNLLLGYTKVGEDELFFAWNYYRYIFHKTLRSCYVHDDNIDLVLKEGFVHADDMGQALWGFKPEQFGVFLEDYLRSVVV